MKICAILISVTALVSGGCSAVRWNTIDVEFVHELYDARIDDVGGFLEPKTDARIFMISHEQDGRVILVLPEENEIGQKLVRIVEIEKIRENGEWEVVAAGVKFEDGTNFTERVMNLQED